jgi:hypothetical protein
MSCTHTNAYVAVDGEVVASSQGIDDKHGAA